MIMISKGNGFGTKSFANQVLASIRPSLIERFGKDSEIMQDFDNEERFFGFIALQDLSKDDFNFVAQQIINANLDEKPKIGLIGAFAGLFVGMIFAVLIGSII
ncbi:hypothetical protein [Moraxella catarrhalis]|uniref:hypothetical protein n=1 Tax=Moraxella catarrhalis TaxID=480 RepID=UPI00128D2498|nr:hypothetical protein [Moraxella catarrhalis]